MNVKLKVLTAGHSLSVSRPVVSYNVKSHIWIGSAVGTLGSYLLPTIMERPTVEHVAVVVPPTQPY